MTRSCLSALAALLLPLCANAQQPGDQPVVAIRKSTGFVMEAGAHDLIDVVDRAAVFLGRNILMHPMEFQQPLEVRLHKRLEVDAPGCWELLNTLLYHKGYAIVPLDAERGFYEVVSMAGPRRGEVSSGAQFVPPEKVVDYAQQKATPIITTVPLEHINATVATNSLRPFFASGGGPQSSLTIGNVGNNKAILLQGFGPQVYAAYQLLRLTDVPPIEASTQFIVVRLEHAIAAEIVPSVERALGTNRAQAVQGMPPSSTFEIVPYSSLNAVILRGTAPEVARVQDLIAALDVPAAAPAHPSAGLAERLEALEQRLRALEKAAGKE